MAGGGNTTGRFFFCTKKPARLTGQAFFVNAAAFRLESLTFRCLGFVVEVGP